MKNVEVKGNDLEWFDILWVLALVSLITFLGVSYLRNMTSEMTPTKEAVQKLVEARGFTQVSVADPDTKLLVKKYCDPKDTYYFEITAKTAQGTDEKLYACVPVLVTDSTNVYKILFH